MNQKRVFKLLNYFYQILLSDKLDVNIWKQNLNITETKCYVHEIKV